MLQIAKSTDRLDNYRLKISEKEFVPIIQGGMGVDISTSELALQIADLGGIGTISDAMIQTVSDKYYATSYTRKKRNTYILNTNKKEKKIVKFDLNDLYEAQSNHIRKTMRNKSGTGDIFVNIMEKLTMNNSMQTLRIRLNAALDSGIDGITLSAGLHLNSFKLMQGNIRFHKAKIGIITSSVRALSLFLRKSKKSKRLPDFIIVEGPLAGGHLGFGSDWKKYNLMTLITEIKTFLTEKKMTIPLIAAGGVFTGSEGITFIKNGAEGVQVATRFTVTKECGLPNSVKQKYFESEKEDIVVNNISPTGYLMRMLKSSPAIGSSIKPNCESFGYILDDNGRCSYVDEYFEHLANSKYMNSFSKMKKTCLCSNMLSFKIWTCGQTTYKLKDTSIKDKNG
ncbi:MAG: nitronate monooxygenase [Planctomycetota bacterium]|nr:MAG: nitronate monooxygenase [Planctomycetota bacterium]